MNQLPGFRRVINGRTFSQSRICDTVYAVVCVAACICIGLLIVSGI